MWKGNIFTVSIKRTIVFVRALVLIRSLQPFLAAPFDKSLARLIRRRPQLLGVVVWTYQCSAWNAKTRLEKIVDHCSVIDEIGHPLDFSVDSDIKLVDLPKIGAGLRLTISQPEWLFRDGLLTMHLFSGEWMIYSLSFSFFHHGNDRAAFIGQIQGDKSDRAREFYRQLTNDYSGMRPRDLLIEMFCAFCSAVSVKHIFAVAEEYRRHHYRYFAKNGGKIASANYNSIWEDRGGVRSNKLYYRLEIERRRRSDKTIPAKKRRMYQTRYAMLESMDAQIVENLSSL